MVCRIDHITITSPTLEHGRQMVYDCLGVVPQNGGEHPRMGTHNLLLRLGTEIFLEIIAANPAAKKPSRPRWFGMDNEAATASPKLACWVVRTQNITESIARTSEALGTVEPMTRGDLEWLISIPEDGSLPMDGVAPALIQWQTGRHPALNLQDYGCQLKALELQHPEPARVRALLQDLGIAEPGVSLSVNGASAPALVATIHTPQGARTLR